MNHSRFISCTVLVLLRLAAPVVAQERGEAPVIWLDRGDTANLDLSLGGGGRGRETGTEFTFIEESSSGTSPKFTVEDDHGVTWKVKLGEEAKSEIAAARLLWAVGYLVDEDYYRARIHVLGLPVLARGREFVSEGDVVTGARLERDAGDIASTHWSWHENPFVGTRAFNGLRVMMALINNWDLKDINNTASAPDGGEQQFSVTDLGATFGRSGDSFARSKQVLEDYAESKFIDSVTSTEVNFVLRSRPFFLSVFNFGNYRTRLDMEGIVRHVPLADARWIGARLGRLSRAQINDCFRAAGFSQEESGAYTDAVMRRIAALEALRATPLEAAAVVDRCLVSTCRDAPERETLNAISLHNPHARAIVGGFDQGGGVGVGVQFTSAGTISGVELRATALVSTRGNERYDIGAFLPRLAGTATHADVWFSYLRRDTGLFVLDPEAGDDLSTDFSIIRRSYQGSLYRDLATHLQGGIYTRVMTSQASLGPATTASRILSYGAFLHYDTRDNSLGLTRGVDLYARAASADSLRQPASAADYGWTERELDARGHVPLIGRTTALLLRSLVQLKAPKDAGRQIPFYDLSWLGGRRALRGYDSYRFRGNNLVLLSTELQHTVRTLTGTRGVDVFGSADAGQTWGGVGLAGDGRTIPALPTNQTFSRDDWHSGVGGGVQ